MEHGKIYRVTRVLEHEGTKDWLEATIKQRTVAGGAERGFRVSCVVRETSISAPEEVRGMSQSELLGEAVAALQRLDENGLAEIEYAWFTRTTEA